MTNGIPACKCVVVSHEGSNRFSPAAAGEKRDTLFLMKDFVATFLLYRVCFFFRLDNGFAPCHYLPRKRLSFSFTKESDGIREEKVVAAADWTTSRHATSHVIVAHSYNDEQQSYNEFSFSAGGTLFPFISIGPVKSKNVHLLA